MDPGTHPTSMVLEKDVGVLAFAEAYFLTPGTCTADLAALDARNPFNWLIACFVSERAFSLRARSWPRYC